jgi:hypothetical protein
MLAKASSPKAGGLGKGGRGVVWAWGRARRQRCAPRRRRVLRCVLLCPSCGWAADGSACTCCRGPQRAVYARTPALACNLRALLHGLHAKRWARTDRRLPPLASGSRVRTPL